MVAHLLASVSAQKACSAGNSQERGMHYLDVEGREALLHLAEGLLVREPSLMSCKGARALSFGSSRLVLLNWKVQSLLWPA